MVFFYFWVREQSNSIYQHYHVVIFSNRSVVQRTRFFKDKIKNTGLNMGIVIFVILMK